MNKDWKKRIQAMAWSALLCTMTAQTAQAQTQTSLYQPGVTTDGAVYFLPQTAVQFMITVEKTSYRPGEFARFAQRHLRLNNVSLEPSTSYRVLDIIPVGVGVADTTKAFAVKFNAKTVAANVSLADDGVLLAINTEPLAVPKPAPFKAGRKPAAIDPHQYMNEEILSAGSTAKMAELTAREIYDLRENRSLLIKGQADFMPSDGEQMKLMLAQIDQQDKALTQLFQGYIDRDTTEHIITLIPTKSINRSVLFRLSERAGLVDADDLRGKPYYVSISDITSLPTNPDAKAKKRKLVDTGIYVNVPGRMRITIEHDERVLSTTEMEAGQFGNVELVSGDLFNKHYTTRLWLDPVSGAVNRLEGEQPK